MSDDEFEVAKKNEIAVWSFPFGNEPPLGEKSSEDEIFRNGYNFGATAAKTFSGVGILPQTHPIVRNDEAKRILWRSGFRQGQKDTVSAKLKGLDRGPTKRKGRE